MSHSAEALTVDKISLDDKSAVAINLAGGLGNQLFQISTAYAYARKNNTPLYIERKERYGDRKSYWNSVYSDMKSKSLDSVINADINHKENNDFYPQNIPFHANKKLLLEGYYQSSFYFKDYRQELIAMFTCKDKSILNYKPKENSCAIHVRRGDYAGIQHILPIQSIEYYQRAIEIMKSKIEISEWYIVSEDIDWIKEQELFRNLNPIFLKQSEELDFWTMSECHHFIIPNSTFSWWASYISDHQDKIVIAPSIWFGPVGPKCYSLKEDNWLIIDS